MMSFEKNTPHPLIVAMVVADLVGAGASATYLRIWPVLAVAIVGAAVIGWQLGAIMKARSRAADVAFQGWSDCNAALRAQLSHGEAAALVDGLKDIAAGRIVPLDTIYATDDAVRESAKRMMQKHASALAKLDDGQTYRAALERISAGGMYGAAWCVANAREALDWRSHETTKEQV